MTAQDAINAYREGGAGDDAQLSTLVTEHGTLVRRIALHLMARLPSHIQVDDLVQAGMLGLLEAASKFDSNRGASFTTYAGIRIRGAMVDEIRRGDWVPRSVHKNSRLITQAAQRVEAREGREAQDREIASELGVDLTEFYKMQHDSSRSRLQSFENLISDDAQDSLSGTATLADMFESLELREEVTRAITELSEREQLVLSLYYTEGLNLKEIGLVLGVGESRVSQIMSKATLRLRGLLESWTER